LGDAAFGTLPLGVTFIDDGGGFAIPVEELLSGDGSIGNAVEAVKSKTRKNPGARSSAFIGDGLPEGPASSTAN